VTTIAQPIAEMGRLGIELLLRRIRAPGAPFERIVLPTRLIPRESTMALPDVIPEKGGRATTAT
jgi:LacI family transcriptional regulator